MEKQNLLTKQEELEEEKKRIQDVERQNANIEKLATLTKKKVELDKLATKIEENQQALKNHHEAKRLDAIWKALNTAKLNVDTNEKSIAELLKELQIKESIETLTQEDINGRVEELSLKISILKDLDSDQQDHKKFFESLPGLEEMDNSAKKRMNFILNNIKIGLVRLHNILLLTASPVSYVVVKPIQVRP